MGESKRMLLICFWSFVRSSGSSADQLPVANSGNSLGDADISELTTEYCMKVLCLARLLVRRSDIRCAAGREVYFKGEKKKLLSVVDFPLRFRLSDRRWPGNQRYDPDRLRMPVLHTRSNLLNLLTR